MPVEPPIVTPRSLADAYTVLAEAPHRPIAGGTDVMVQLTGELGPVPDRMVDLWRLDELRGRRRDAEAFRELGLVGVIVVVGIRREDAQIARAVTHRDAQSVEVAILHATGPSDGVAAAAIDSMILV